MKDLILQINKHLPVTFFLILLILITPCICICIYVYVIKDLAIRFALCGCIIPMCKIFKMLHRYDNI